MKVVVDISKTISDLKSYQNKIEYYQYKVLHMHSVQQVPLWVFNTDDKFSADDESTSS